VYKIHNKEEFYKCYDETGELVMLLQEEVKFKEYFRCYCLGGKYVHMMQYDPRAPFHERYVRNPQPISQDILDKVEQGVIALNQALGYDFNTVEFAIWDGVPYAIDFCNPAPDADVHSVGEANFEWIIENAANMAIERALAHKPDQDNLTWGTYMKEAIGGHLK